MKYLKTYWLNCHKFWCTIHLRMNCENFGDLLSFHLAPLSASFDQFYNQITCKKHSHRSHRAASMFILSLSIQINMLSFFFSRIFLLCCYFEASAAQRSFHLTLICSLVCLSCLCCSLAVAYDTLVV